MAFDFKFLFLTRVCFQYMALTNLGLLSYMALTNHSLLSNMALTNLSSLSNMALTNQSLLSDLPSTMTMTYQSFLSNPEFF